MTTFAGMAAPAAWVVRRGRIATFGYRDDGKSRPMLEAGEVRSDRTPAQRRKLCRSDAEPDFQSRT